MPDSNPDRDVTRRTAESIVDGIDATTPLDALQEQLEHAAAAFADGDDDLDDLLTAMSADVERASTEPLEVVPISHHSPASAVHTARRLRELQPDVVYLELCEDLQSVLEELAECTLPVALQAFTDESEAFPAEWTPLTVVAPLTEFSAEAQAIGYALATDAEVVFVDRSVDHVFQAADEAAYIEDQLPSQEPDADADDGKHGSALGLQIGDTEPTFDAFRRFLLRNARVRHWTEWWNQYVEQPIITADYETYRHALFLVGTLLRRIGRRDEDRAEDRFREEYMWTRIKEHMADESVDPADAVYVCGAIHAVSDVEQYGVDNDRRGDVPARTDTDWQYGIVPSSYREIDRQYGHPPGTTKRNEHTWKKTRRAVDVPSYDVARGGVTLPDDGPTPDLEERLAETVDETADFLGRPPELVDEDDDQLLNWCIDVVDAARDEGYAASTADAIAVYEHAKLLAKMRNRPHPTPYDFREAAITCIQKTEPTGRTSVGALCDRVLGGDREGTVGYASLPPLVQDVYDRLDALPIDPEADTIERALLDFQADPEYREPAELLWRLHYLLGDADVVRPIMGTRELGHEPVQESWDVLTGKNQRPLIELGYQGVTVEQVLEMELKADAYGADADAVSALQATRDSIVYLDSARLTDELGRRAVELLAEETGADNAGPIFEQARELVHHFRSEPDGIPDWLEAFVAEGYSQYSKLLPTAFADDDTSPEEIADMLAFIFTLESLALSIGRDREELEIAVGQAADVDTTPDKLGLLWAAELLLERRTADDVRAFFDRALDNRMLAQQIPEYLRGLVLSMRFTKRVGRLVVELLSNAFARLPDDVLLPWLPDLLLMLEPVADEFVPELVQEAGRAFPQSLTALDAWVPEWERDGEPTASAGRDRERVDLSERERAVHDLVSDTRTSAACVASHLDLDGEWTALPADEAGTEPGAVIDDERARDARTLLFDHRRTGATAADHLDLEGTWTRALPQSSAPTQRASGRERAVRDLLDDYRSTTDGIAALMDIDAAWTDAAAALESGRTGASDDPVSDLLAEHAATLRALRE